jgi:hypothetical protein
MNEFDSKEINDLPKDDSLYKSLHGWAEPGDDYRPFNASVLPKPKKPRTWTGWRAAATLAAAAMFVFALGQTSFSVTVGDTTLRWGAEAQADFDSLATALAEAQARNANIDQSLAAHADAINAIAVDNALLLESLQATAFQLAHRQELESAARVYDMQNLAQFVAYQQQGD